MRQGFGWAIEQLITGHRVRRLGWNGKGMYIELQTPDEHSKMKRPYIFICSVGGDLVPWTAAQPDMLSFDWELAE